MFISEGIIFCELGKNVNSWIFLFVNYPLPLSFTKLMVIFMSAKFVKCSDIREIRENCTLRNSNTLRYYDYNLSILANNKGTPKNTTYNFTLMEKSDISDIVISEKGNFLDMHLS